MQAGEHIDFGPYGWRVLEVRDGAALIITQDIIGQRPYHDKPGAVTWAGCALRGYLNGAFYEGFGRSEQARIRPVTNQNPDNHWYGTGGGEDTRDNIFLLSLEDAACRYFGDSGALLYHPGKNQRYWFQRKDPNNGRRAARYGGYGWWWWLRSPGRAGNRAVYIWGDGNIGIQGNGTFRYASTTLHPVSGDNSGGVRPALWLNL